MPKVECGFASGLQLVHFGPTLPVRIGFDANYRPGNKIILPEDEYPALVDTGAVQSCIDSELASALQLPIVDRTNVAGALGKGPVNMHLAQIYIPALDSVTYGEFAGVHLNAGGQPHTALIGRTFLQHYSMNYNGTTGSVILSRQ